MTNIIITLADETKSDLKGPELAKIIMDDLVEFDIWFAQNAGSPLSNFEKAAICTYVYSKLVGRVSNKREAL